MLAKSNRLVFILTIFSVLAIILQATFRNGLGFDETYLGLSFFNDGYSHLLKPLVREQIAPIGFLFVEQFLYHLIPSGSEATFAQYFLRIPVVIAGVLSVCLFYPLVHKITKDKLIATIAFILFACNPFLIYYSSEVKPYIFELLFTILILFSYYNYSENKNDANKKIFRTTMSISIFFSFASVFILFAIGLYDSIIAVKNKSVVKERIIELVSVYAFPLLVILAYYSIFLYGHDTMEFMHKFWDGKQFSPMKLSGELMFINKYVFSVLVALGIVMGLKQKQYKILFITCSVLFVHLVFSLLKLYPASHIRMILFWISLLPIILAFGLSILSKAINSKPALLILGVYVAVLIFNFAFEGIKFPFYFRGKEIRSDVEYVVANYKSGDLVYIDATSSYIPFMDVIPYYKGIGLMSEFMDIQKVLLDNKKALRLQNGVRIEQVCKTNQRVLFFANVNSEYENILQDCEYEKLPAKDSLQLYIVEGN